MALKYGKNNKYISRIFDTKNKSIWGRLNLKMLERHEQVRLFARTGNSFLPNKNWTSWIECQGNKIKNPKARFIQLKIEMDAYKNKAPKISALEINFSQKNNRPKITSFQIGKNLKIIKKYKISLKKHEKMLSWRALDADGDVLNYDLYYRALKDKSWILLEKDIDEHFCLINSLAFPNGEYQFKLIAKERLGNSLKDSFSVERLSAPMSIDNTPPNISELNIFEDKIEFTISDEDSIIGQLQYSVNKKDFNQIFPEDKVFDAYVERFSIKREKSIKEIIIYGKDRSGNTLLKTIKIE